MHNLAVLVHDSPLGEGLLAVRAGWGKPADRGVLRVGVDRIGLLALTALLERKYFLSSGSLNTLLPLKYIIRGTLPYNIFMTTSTYVIPNDR